MAVLIDHWADQAALDAHHDSPVMQKILMLREKYDLHMRVERYTVKTGALPDQDQAFVRA